MKPDSQVRFSIIGWVTSWKSSGTVLPRAWGGSDLAERAIATTADKDDLERKRQHFKIPVQLGGNLEALKANRPDIIFFALRRPSPPARSTPL